MRIREYNASLDKRAELLVYYTEKQNSDMETKKETNKQLEEINVKVNALNLKEFSNYQENKKIIKDKIVGAIGGTIGTGVIALILWAISKFV